MPSQTELAAIVARRGAVIAQSLNERIERTRAKQKFTGMWMPVEVPVAELVEITAMLTQYGEALQIQARIMAKQDANVAALEKAVAVGLEAIGALRGLSFWALVRYWWRRPAGRQ